MQINTSNNPQNTTIISLASNLKSPQFLFDNIEQDIITFDAFQLSGKNILKVKNVKDILSAQKL